MLCTAAANSQVKEEREARDGRLDKGGGRLMEKRADEQSHSLGYCSINTKQPLPSRDQDSATFLLARFQDQDLIENNKYQDTNMIISNHCNFFTT